MLESSSDAIFAKDCEGRYVAVNTSAAAALGFTLDQMIGHTDAEHLKLDQELRTEETMLLGLRRSLMRLDSPVQNDPAG